MVGGGGWGWWGVVVGGGGWAVVLALMVVSLVMVGDCEHFFLLPVCRDQELDKYSWVLMLLKRSYIPIRFETLLRYCAHLYS